MSQITPPPQDESVIDIGARLKQTREEKDISISTAAMQTNLRPEVIEKLEANDFATIGAPVFTRGYLNIYARFLGLDEEEIAKSFAVVHDSEHKKDKLRLNTANIESQNKPYRRSVARGWFSLLLVLIIGGILIGQLLDNQSWLMQQIRGTFAQQNNLDETDDAAAHNEPVVPSFTVEVANEETQRDTSLPVLTSAEEAQQIDVPTPDQSLQSATTPELSLSALDTADGAADADLRGDVAVAEPVLPAVKREAVLKTNRENWMEITDSNGKIVDSRIFKANETIRLPAGGAPYRLNIGRPNAVTLTVNGEDKALDSYRRKGKTRLFELSIPNE